MTQRGGGGLGCHSAQKDGRVVKSTRRLQFTSKGIRSCSFVWEAEWTPALLNADRKIRSRDISKDPTGNRKWDLPSCSAVPQPTAPMLAPLYINIQERQCTCNITLGAFTRPLLQWKSNEYYIRLCVCACSVMQHAMRRRHIVCGLSGLTTFFDIIS